MPLVLICLGAAQLSLFLEGRLDQRLPGATPERLLAFRGVDALQSHLDLLVLPRLATSGGQGIAVRDADDKAEKWIGELWELRGKVRRCKDFSVGAHEPQWPKHLY